MGRQRRGARCTGLPPYGIHHGLLGTNGNGANGAEGVIDNGSPLPPPAPPGGCGRAVQP
ncbi:MULTISPECIES: hypothetical protein [Mycolicibacter]|uniref:hypothetical protein n=1 Tax=Mycolicibacter TaxID=1073531 RepID=UPI000A42B8C5|nr:MULTISPECIES: hypothetical protein [Mycolicibacter]